MRRTFHMAIIATIISFLLTLLAPAVYGEKIKLLQEEKIEFQDSSHLHVIPRSFIVSEDRLFLLPNHESGFITVFKRVVNTLEFEYEFGPDGIADKRFGNPSFCFYAPNNRITFGVIDVHIEWKLRGLHLFERKGDVDFVPVGRVPGAIGSDVKMAEDGKHVIVAGYYIEEKSGLKNSYDLYSYNVENKTVKPLLFSYQKYDLNNDAEYQREYFEKRTIPALGIRSHIDVWGDFVYHVWEGKLKVKKININTGEHTELLQPKDNDRMHQYFVTPSASKDLLEGQKTKNNLKTRKARDKMSFIRDLIVTSKHVILIYRGPNIKGNHFRFQVYTHEGTFVGDKPIPGSYYQKIWFDKEIYNLYCLNQKEKIGKSEIIVYKLETI